MGLAKINPTHTKAWQKLQAHFNTIKNTHMSDLFAQDKSRANTFSIQWEDFYLDFSKNRITSETFKLLLDLAKEVKLKEAIECYFRGNKINETESKAVLHTALRTTKNKEIVVDGKDIVPEINQTKQRIETLTNAVINGQKTGYTGKPFTTIVNIGIGGSDLGPAMVVDALDFYANHLNIYFVNNIDSDHLSKIINDIDPETTLFVIVSKTFTTQETLCNANTLKKWFLKSAPQTAIQDHFVAVSANIKQAKLFGINDSKIFPIWDWVGGRFSLWSAAGLTISLAIGYDNFNKLLLGANCMDTHFKTQSFDKNIPVVLAIISIWYNNFFNTESEAVIPYTQSLKQFIPFLQQVSMESNGKCVDRNQNSVQYQTGNIIWGGVGTNSQHAFFQLIYQGTKLIPADFIAFSQSLDGNREHQKKLISNFIAQTEALLYGKTQNTNFPFKVFEGNKPTNSILIKQLNPESLGKLIAMYEHKVFVQGVIWNIFSFDQYGVELGKKLANNVLNTINNSTPEAIHNDATTNILQQFLMDFN